MTEETTLGTLSKVRTVHFKHATDGAKKVSQYHEIYLITYHMRCLVKQAITFVWRVFWLTFRLESSRTNALKTETSRPDMQDSSEREYELETWKLTSTLPKPGSQEANVT